MPRKILDKSRTAFVCQECGCQSPKWLGRCPDCGAWNKFLEEPAGPAKPGKRAAAPQTAPVKLAEVDLSAVPRLRTGINEFDNVLGGGFVPGSMVLVGGDPGIGKSTLLMQAAYRLAAAGARILYVSGEESASQIKLRANRLGSAPAELDLLCSTDLEEVLANARRIQPAVMIVDSIQTLSHPEVSSVPGAVGQVRECGAALMDLAKHGGPAVVLVGHVTKEGVLAGPRVLEHLVDTVIYFEGDRQHGFRILRAAKNRFGSTNEVGIFEMRADGLAEVGEPSRLFLQERHPENSGCAVAVSLEGTRPLLLEIQALVAPSYFGLPQRRVSGLDYNRCCLMLAVLEKRGGIALGSQDVFLSVAGGLAVDEPAVDLAVIVAVASGQRDQPLDPQTAFFGEVGLGGEIRAVSQAERRVQEAQKLGFKRCLLPQRNQESLAKLFGLELVGVETVQQALGMCFAPAEKKQHGGNTGGIAT
jgi:DNA repair protein RadA/Sms